MDLLVEDSAIREKDMVQRQLAGKSEDSTGTDIEMDMESESLIQNGSSSNTANEESSSFPIKLDSNVDVEIGAGGTKRKGIKKFFQKVGLQDKTSAKMHILDEARRMRDTYREKNTSKAALITAWDVNAFAEDIEGGGEVNDTESQHSSMTGNEVELNGGMEMEEKKFNTSWMTQFRILLHRSLKNSRSAVLTTVNIVKCVALGILTGFLWFQMPNDETHVRDRGALLFFSSTYWIFEGTFSSIFTFPTERAIIFKERASGSYYLSAYFVSKTLSEMPTRLILPSTFWLIVYWMADINPRVDVFLGTLGCLLISVLAGESYGLLCGAIVMDLEKAMAIMIVISLTSMAAGGFYVENIPVWLSWTKFVSPFKFGYEASQILVFDRDVPCDGSGNLAEFCTGDADYVSSEDVLETLGSEGSVGLNVCILVILTVVPRYLAFLALKSKRGAERS